VDKLGLAPTDVMVGQRKRNTLEIMESILSALKDGPDLKTNIAYKAKIDSRTIGRYLPLLLDLHMIATTPSGKYKLDRKGLGFMKQYSKLKEYNPER
jgi:predicted transcriptional regulator